MRVQRLPTRQGRAHTTSHPQTNFFRTDRSVAELFEVQYNVTVRVQRSATHADFEGRGATRSSQFAHADGDAVVDASELTDRLRSTLMFKALIAECVRRAAQTAP